MNTVEINFDAVLARVSIEDYVERRWGAPAYGAGRRTRKWLCPFHDERTASFHVDTDRQTWRCFGACGVGGNIFDLAQYAAHGRIDNSSTVIIKDGRNTIDWSHPKMQAYLEIHGGVSQYAPVVVRPDLPPRPEQPLPKLTDAQRYAARGEEAWSEYFCERQIAHDTVINRVMGKRSDFYWNAKLPGEETHRMSCDRYTIPWFYGDKMIGIQQRRDDVKAIEKMYGLDPNLIDRIRIDAATAFNTHADKRGLSQRLTPDEITDKDVLDRLFGPKYFKEFGSKGAIFNVNRLLHLDSTGAVQLNDHKLPELNWIDYVLIVEGEIDCLSTEDAGFPCTGGSGTVKHNVDYSYIYSRVKRRFVIGDGDEAGRSKAMDYAVAMGGNYHDTQILIVPPPWKDINDMLCAGEATHWLAKHGVYPCLPVKQILVAA